MTPSRLLWYFADPMCSWCWGFSPVINAIKDAYSAQLQIALLLGGLRPGTTEPLGAAQRTEILHHWHAVHTRTGQPFLFEGALPDGFVYDTEPSSRAVITVADINSDVTFPYLNSVQEAFYAHQQDVTRTQMLANLAVLHQVAESEFLERFHSDEMKTKTRMHFQQTQQAGVRGFPTVLLQKPSGITRLSHGYRPFEELRPEIEAWLAGPE